MTDAAVCGHARNEEGACIHWQCRMYDTRTSLPAGLPFPCCAHCACPNGERVGHDDTCTHGCCDDGENDEAQVDALAARLAGDVQSDVTARMLATELVREGWLRQ